MKIISSIAQKCFLTILILFVFLTGAPFEGIVFYIRDLNVVDTMYHASHDGNVIDSIVRGGLTSGIKEVYADGTTDALMVYDRLAGTSTPKYRLWNGTAWGSELSVSDVSGTEIRSAQLKYAPTRDEAILVVLTNTGQVQAQVFNGTSWGASTVLVTVTDTFGSPDGGSIYRAFDIEYEQSSGDAIVVAQDGTADPNYYVWNGTSWASGVDINIPTTGFPNWIELASRPGTDELALITLDSNTDVYGMRWTGSAWDNMGTAATWDATASIATKKAIDVAFEKTSGDIMFAWGFATAATAHFRYRTYVSPTLSAVTNFVNANQGGVVHWLRLASDPTAASNNIMIGVLDAGADLNTVLWNGTAWGTVHPEHSATTEDILDSNFDIVFETHASNPNDAWLFFANGTDFSLKRWDGVTSAWTATGNTGDDTATIMLNSQPNSGAVFALAYEDDTSATKDLREVHVTGGGQAFANWSTVAQIWDGPVQRNMGLTRMALASQAYNASTEAMMVYVTEANTSYPQFRRWTGSAWSAQGDTSPTSGEIRHMVTKASSKRDETMLVTVGHTGRVEAQVRNGVTGTWGASQLIATMNNANGSRDAQSLYRAFDVEYEDSSGDAIVVANNGAADPIYSVWNGTSWTGPTTIDIPTTGRPNWIELASRPGTDELALITLDSNTDVYGMRWTGSAWDNMGTAATWDATASIATKKAIDVAYETNSGDIMFIWGDSVATDQYYRTYSGGVLSGATRLGNAQAGGLNNWMILASNPASTSNQIMYGVLDAGADLNTLVWDGSAWGTVHAEHTAGAETIASQTFDIKFETHSSNVDDAWLVYGDGNTISRKLWDGPTSTWGAATTQGDDTDYVVLGTQPTTGAVFLGGYEGSGAASDDITENRLTGGTQTWGSAAIMWSGPVPRSSLPYMRIGIVGERYRAPTFEQASYRLFANTDSTDVGSALAALNTPANIPTVGGAFRLRNVLHVGTNTLFQNGQAFKLQFAGKGVGTCAAPSGGTPASYTDITDTTVIAYVNNATPADGAALTANANDPTHSGHIIVNQTYEESNNFTNSQSSILAGQDGKWDFALFDNGAPISTTYCIRAVKSDGQALTTYTTYPEITTASGGNSLPVASAISIDSGAASIVPNEGTTKNVSCVGTVTDNDGYADITSVTADLFRTSLGIGSSLDNNNHYRLVGDSQCIPSGGSGSSETYTCTFPIQYFADATDAGSPYAADNWKCVMTPSDTVGAGTAAEDTVEMASLSAFDVTATINYGTLAPNTNTGATNQITTVTNTGNRDVDPDISGEPMTSGPSSIPETSQKYSSTAFTYTSGGVSLTTTPVLIDLTLPQRTDAVVSDDVFWGISVPNGTAQGSYSGVNTFTTGI